MREIKFKAKSIKTGDWVFGDLCTLEDNLSIAFDDENCNYCSVYVDGRTLGQFTGLQDVNGIDIYEGDIITDSNYFYDNSAPVVWNDVEAQFIADYEEEPMNIWPDCKVIGNIHDKEEQ